jgi:predicted Zn-dependent protease
MRTLLLVVAAASVGVVPEAAQSRRTLAALGRFDPPAYAQPLVRSGDPSPVFDDAIAAYGRRQFERAADLLRRMVAADPDDLAANFYLAASLMMTDEVGEAEDRLRAVLSAEPSAFTLPARLVLARALIRQGRLDAADDELSAVARDEGPSARAAGDLLARLRAARTRE